jgi:hypothetical protein
VAEASIIVHPEWDLTEIILTGELTIAEIIEELQRINQGPGTKLALWDISEVSFSSFRGEDVAKTSAIVMSLVQERAGNKTAAVAGSDLNYGLTRMYQAYREDQFKDMPFRTFRTRQEAIDWLRSDAT